MKARQDPPSSLSSHTHTHGSAAAVHSRTDVCLFVVLLKILLCVSSPPLQSKVSSNAQSVFFSSTFVALSLMSRTCEVSGAWWCLSCTDFTWMYVPVLVVEMFFWLQEVTKFCSEKKVPSVSWSQTFEISQKLPPLARKWRREGKHYINMWNYSL